MLLHVGLILVLVGLDLLTWEGCFDVCLWV